MATSFSRAQPSQATTLLSPGAMKTINGDIFSLIQAIQEDGPAKTVQDYLEPLGLADQALTVVDLLHLCRRLGEVAGAIVTHIWEDFIAHDQLWDHYQGGKSQFLKDIDYKNFVHPTLKAAKASEKAKVKNIACIEAAWGKDWKQTIDMDADHPSDLSEKYLRNMANLARNGMTLSDAKVLLELVITARVSHPGRGIRRLPAIIPSDILTVAAAVEAVSNHYNQVPQECSLQHLTIFLDHGKTALPAAVPETPQIPQNSPSPPVLPLPSGAQPSTVEVFYNQKRCQFSLELEYANRSEQAAAVSAPLGLSQTETLAATPPPHGLPTPDPSPHSKHSCPALPVEQHPNPHPLSLAIDEVELAPPSVSHQFSSPGARTPSSSTPALHSSPEPSPAPIITTPNNHDSPTPPPLRAARRPTKSGFIRPARVPKPRAAPQVATQPGSTPAEDSPPRVSQLRPRVQATNPALTRPDPAPIDPSIQDNRSPSNSQPPEPQAWLTPSKRRYSEYASDIWDLPELYNFELADGWADSSPVTASLREQGFYKGLEVMQFANADSHIAIHNQLGLFDHLAKSSEELAPFGKFHTLLQQVLVQSPYVYLTALAAMKTTNHRLISLPVPLITLPGSQDSKLMDSTFPFQKYIESEKEVPGTRLLYSLNDATLSLGTGLSAKEKVQAWWAASGGDLNRAAEQVQPEHFSAVPLQAGELIAMPPQLLWSVGADISGGGSSDATPASCKFAEVRYISVTPKRKLDFDYWPNIKGSGDISCFNRDLLVPTVTGWGVELGKSRKRKRGAVEMRGVWAIGDALLGLTRWDSELVKLELDQLFDAPDGDWFNRKFAAQVQSMFNQKLASMVETLEQAQKRAFGSTKK